MPAGGCAGVCAARSVRVAWLHVVLAAVLLAPASAMVGTTTMELAPQEWRQFQQFGFLTGGTYELDMVYSGGTGPVVLLACSSAEWRDIKASGVLGPGGNACNEDQQIACASVARGEDGMGRIVRSSPEETTFYFVAGSCQDSSASLSVQVDWILQNPEGEHLSTSVIPMPYILVSFAFVTLILTVLWLFNIARRASQAGPWIKVHSVITAALLAKLALIAYAYTYYLELSDTGVETTSQRVTLVLLTAVYYSIGYLTLCLLGLGYGVTSPILTRPQIRLLAGILIAVLVGTMLTEFVSPLFALLTAAAYVATLWYTLVQATARINALKTILLSIRAAGFHATTTPYFRKYAMMRNLRASVGVFAVADGLRLAVAVSLLSETVWIGELWRELAEVFILLSIGRTFALADFRPYIYDPYDPATPDWNDPMIIEATTDGSGLRSWIPGMTLDAMIGSLTPTDDQDPVVLVKLPPVQRRAKLFVPHYGVAKRIVTPGVDPWDQDDAAQPGSDSRADDTAVA